MSAQRKESSKDGIKRRKSDAVDVNRLPQNINLTALYSGPSLVSYVSSLAYHPHDLQSRLSIPQVKPKQATKPLDQSGIVGS